MARQSWLDEATQTPLIDQYARQLGSFIEAMADGKIDEDEVAAQEERLVRLMKELEPQLDDSTHAKVTELLCELTAYNLMQIFHAVNQARPKVEFRG
jgi:flagellin-specific chaperone FliS